MWRPVLAGMGKTYQSPIHLAGMVDPENLLVTVEHGTEYVDTAFERH